MSDFIEPYKTLLGNEVIDQLFQIASLLKGKKILHVNSTKEGGGVAEILAKMVPLTNAIGIETRWETIKGIPAFFDCTKKFHNLIQGMSSPPPSKQLLEAYEAVNESNANDLRPLLEESDIVFIHDPQPLGLIKHVPNKKGKWIWRCHVESSHPSRRIWGYLREMIVKYDASIFSLEDFAQPLEHPTYLIPPSIDPLSEKNIELDREEILKVHKTYGIDSERPIILQVSRFDRFKDPLGVVRAFQLAQKFYPALQLVLAGGGASDDPEGMMVYNEVLEACHNCRDIHVLLLPSNAHREVNALQRGADIVLQKSIKEGFGLTVTEALWKQKPVIGGNTGGIRLQVVNHHTGFLVNTPEGAAHRMRYLLQNPQIAKDLGMKGRKLVKDNFLITRHLREYLTVMTTLLFPRGDRINLSQKI